MDEAVKQDIQTAAQVRIEFYRFLASIYKLELTSDQIEAAAHTDFPLDESLVGQGYAQISEYLRHRDSGTRQELAVDYAHTFLGAGSYDTIKAPPYESVYTSEGRLLMQDARDSAVAFYRREGLGLPADNTTPEDHISFEMQFMALLIERSCEALTENKEEVFKSLLEQQNAFFEQHLINWIPALSEDVLRHARTDFYRGIALITQGFLAEERDMLQALSELEGIKAA